MHDYLHYMLFNSQFGVAYHFVAEEGFMQFVHNVEANYKATGDLKQPCNRKSVAGQLLEDENKTLKHTRSFSGCFCHSQIESAGTGFCI